MTLLRRASGRAVYEPRRRRSGAPTSEGENGDRKRALWYFATATSVGEEASDGTRRVVVAYDEGGDVEDIAWPNSDAVSLPADQGNLARAATVTEEQASLKGANFKMQGDSREYRVADVFYSIEEGIDGVVVQYYDTDRYPTEPPTEDQLDALAWAPFDEFQSRATLENAEDLAPPPREPLGPHRRSGRAPAPKVIVDAPDERPASQKRRANSPRETVELTGMHVGKTVEGAQQKKNGKWINTFMFPGREFNDLDELRAAKKQRKERRAAYSDQARMAPKC